MQKLRDLNRAFHLLRSNGYFAEQDFMCCQTCALAMIPDQCDRYVFYHNQDADLLTNTGQCYVSWHGDPDEICELFQSLGIETLWDGDATTRIKIIF